MEKAPSAFSMLPAFLLYYLSELEIRQRNSMNFGGCYLPDDPGCNLHCCWCVIYNVCRNILKFGGYGFPHITFPSMLTSTDLDCALWSRIFDDCDSCYIIYKSYAIIITKRHPCDQSCAIFCCFGDYYSIRFIYDITCHSRQISVTIKHNLSPWT